MNENDWGYFIDIDDADTYLYKCSNFRIVFLTSEIVVYFIGIVSLGFLSI